MPRLTRRVALCAALVFGLQHVSVNAWARAPMDGDVLVFGGTGKLGAEVAKALIAGGHGVTVFARPTSDHARLDGLDIAYVEGDVLNESDVNAAFAAAKFKAAVDALARGRSGPEFYDISEKNISTAAAATGVSQVILHSSVGAGDSQAVYPKERWEAMKPTLMAKDAGEKHLMASGVTYTIIRNAVLRNSKPGDVDGAKLTEDQSAFGAVTRVGLGRLTAECIGNPDCANKIFHAVDPGVHAGGE
ncbi:MAG: NAD(P)H-binding protein [Rhodobacteraceae bacterium]|nr:NAD(P)H-binding protein [Paracoccaceae bacterium]